jgi:hypothetical protein
VPGDGDGRPGRGGRGEKQQAALPHQHILAALAPGDAVTFPELAARLEAHGVEVDGDESLALRLDPRAILWSCWRPEVIDAVAELVGTGRVVVERCPPGRYRGQVLSLPLAPVARPAVPLACEHWWPATIQLAQEAELRRLLGQAGGSDD